MLIGKWHLGLTSPNLPNERGFDGFRGFLGDMMDDYVTHRRGGQNFMRHDDRVIDPMGHATDLFTDWACEYLTERVANKPPNSRSPFFLYLAYNAPHDPLQPPPEWLARVKQREPGINDRRAALVGLIEHMDAGIGKILDTLDQLQLAENTLVFLTSDNGGVRAYQAAIGPWRGDKQHMYEGGLRVPAIARWPNRIAAAGRTERVAVTMDLFATILDVAGVPRPGDIDGVSFLPTLLGQTQPAEETPRELYFVRREGGPEYGGKTIKALIKGDWKIVQDSPFQPPELYNLKLDPHETTNRAQTDKQVLHDLEAALRRHIQRGGKTPWQQPSP